MTASLFVPSNSPELWQEPCLLEACLKTDKQSPLIGVLNDGGNVLGLEISHRFPGWPGDIHRGAEYAECSAWSHQIIRQEDYPARYDESSALCLRRLGIRSQTAVVELAGSCPGTIAAGGRGATYGAGRNDAIDVGGSHQIG